MPPKSKIHSKLYKKEKKGLNDLDNHNGVVTHLEPGILECEVKWTLGSITMNKASGGDGISANVLTILEDNDDGVVTHLEPGILGCEVKWKHHYEQI